MRKEPINCNRHKRKIRNLLRYLFAFLFFAGGCVSLFLYVFYTPDSIEQQEYDLGEAQKQIVLKDEIYYDLEEMKRQNADFAGWIYIPNTLINLPVVQGEDNSFYLTHGFTKAKSVFGCPFLEYDAEKTDQNKVIHGHNMGSNSDKIFSTLVDYQNPDYAKKHRYIYFSEPDVEGQIYEVFAVMNYNLALLKEESYLRHNFEDTAQYNQFVS